MLHNSRRLYSTWPVFLRSSSWGKVYVVFTWAHLRANKVCLQIGCEPDVVYGCLLRPIATLELWGNAVRLPILISQKKRSSGQAEQKLVALRQGAWTESTHAAEVTLSEDGGGSQSLCAGRVRCGLPELPAGWARTVFSAQQAFRFATSQDHLAPSPLGDRHPSIHPEQVTGVLFLG